jgi:hypothetical protein
MHDLDDYVRAQVRRMAAEVEGADAFESVETRFRRRRRRRSGRKAALVVVVLAATVLGVIGLEQVFKGSNIPAVGATTSKVASIAVGGDLRVTLVARRPAASDREASVILEASVRRSGRWLISGRRSVGRLGGWSWNALTNRGGVCRLLASDAPRPRVTVSLRLQADRTCSTSYKFSVKGRKVVPG